MSVRELWLRLDAMLNTGLSRQTQSSLCYSCAQRDTMISTRGLSICSVCWGDADPIPFDAVFVKEYPALRAAAQKRAMVGLVMAGLFNKLQQAHSGHIGICDCCLSFGHHADSVSGDIFCDKCVFDAVNRGNDIIAMILVIGEITFTSIPDVNKLIRFTSAYIMIQG